MDLNSSERSIGSRVSRFDWADCLDAKLSELGEGWGFAVLDWATAARLEMPRNKIRTITRAKGARTTIGPVLSRTMKLLLS